MDLQRPALGRGVRVCILRAECPDERLGTVVQVDGILRDIGTILTVTGSVVHAILVDVRRP